MKENLSPGAIVRRDFRRTRSLKSDARFPLHPQVVWELATEALAEFRERLKKAGQETEGTMASVVYVRREDGEVRPAFLEIEKVGAPDELRSRMFDALLKPDHVAIGMVFTHHDPAGGSDGGRANAVFPYQFTGLSEEAVMHLRAACAVQMNALTMLQKEN